jgi:hypothetical protein
MGTPGIGMPLVQEDGGQECRAWGCPRYKVRVAGLGMGTPGKGMLGIRMPQLQGGLVSIYCPVSNWTSTLMPARRPGVGLSRSMVVL